MDRWGFLVLWPRAIIYGTLLSGLLIGVWEWEDLALRRRWTVGGRVMLTVGVPVTLVLVDRFGPMDVPYGVLVVALIAMWYLVPRSSWNFVGSVAIFGAEVIHALTAFGWSQHTLTELLMIVVLTLVLRISSSRVTGLKRHTLLYVSVILAAIISMVSNGDGVSDLVTSVTVAAVAAVYIVGRSDRAQKWGHDIYRAEHDALTDALTRHGLVTWLDQLTPRARSTGLIVACDLDDFKWFNDTWGHDLGDQVLKAFARRLQTGLRDQDALARPGGDEFTVWIPGGPLKNADAEQIVQRLHRAVTEQTYSLTTGPFRLGVSMGWAVGPLTEGTDKAADQNLLAAKRGGKNRVAPKEVDSPDLLPDTPVPFAQLGWLGDAARALWDRWPTAAVLTNVAGRIIAVNPAYERLTGRTWAELAEQEPGVNTAGETPSGVYQALWDTLKKGNTWEGSLKNRRPDGTTWWAEESIVPLFVGTQVMGYWGTIRESNRDGNALLGTEEPALADISQEQHFFNGLSFDVFFQPVVDLQTTSVFGQEALIRPQRHGISVSPLTLFAEALKEGVDDQLDLACLRAIRHTIGTMGVWPSNQKLFVNMRCTTLKDPPTFRYYLQSLSEVVPWGQLVVEVSEQGTTAIQDWEAFSHLYPHVVFAQDDLGAGEADLARLVRLHPAWVKIDILLVARIVDNDASRTLVRGLTQWAHGMGAQVIAEGVETDAQATLLRQFGVDAGQGYVWAHPAPQLETRISPSSKP